MPSEPLRHSTTLTLPTPEGFEFWRTVRSHGWYALPPFSHDESSRTLSRILSLQDGSTVACVASGNDHAVRVHVNGHHALTREQRLAVKEQIARCLRLDEDFAPFHAAVRNIPRFKWIAESGSGRMLRSPSVFEDVVKMICTTNCTWALTTVIVTNLVHRLGKEFESGHHAFPSPQAIAETSEKFLRKEVKAGYRAPYLLELARRVANNDLGLESWRTSPLPTDELFAEMRKVKGIGPYAAGNIMKLIGRYDYLGLDSWVRARYFELHRKGRHVKDSTIERDYRQYGRWRGLVFWLEMTRTWHEEKFSL